MTWHVWEVTYLQRKVTLVCGVSYHLLGSQISQDSKIRFQLQVKSYIRDWQFSKLWHLARYVSCHNAMAYDSTTVRSLTKSRRTCQTNKKQKLQYGYLPSKLVITVPWRVLCVDLIDPYTHKGKDGTIIDLMALTNIDSATNWFEVVDLPLLRRLKTITVNSKESSIVEEIFDKISQHRARLVNKTWLSRYPRCRYIIYDNGSKFKLNFEYHCETYITKHKPTTIKNP